VSHIIKHSLVFNWLDRKVTLSCTQPGRRRYCCLNYTIDIEAWQKPTRQSPQNVYKHLWHSLDACNHEKYSDEPDWSTDSDTGSVSGVVGYAEVALPGVLQYPIKKTIIYRYVNYADTTYVTGRRKTQTQYHGYMYADLKKNETRVPMLSHFSSSQVTPCPVLC